jgi:UDP-N-acetylmuramoylalanine--D-glutamate ligase
VWVGGNIGIPLIEKIDEIRPDDLVLLELSSFQLDLMKTVPHIGAILNITPNHLDRHGTMEAYTQAKLNLFRYQSDKDIAIINHDDPGTWRERDLIPGTMATFGFQRCRLPIIQAYQKEDQLILNDGQRDFFLFNVNDIKLRGKHNILNVMAACVTAYCAGVPLTELRETVRHFKGVSHRLEFIRHYKGVSWFNDSIATSPERSMAAIRSFAEPLVVLLGGRDKDLPWENLAKLIHRRVHDVILFGEAADMIEPILKEHRCASSLVHITKCNTLHDAVLEAKKVAQNGDVVLLSPGGTSFDEFKDFAERGERFKEWVQQIS